ncbi:MAG: thioredoxin [Verrucomicrobiota bacterium]
MKSKSPNKAALKRIAACIALAALAMIMAGCPNQNEAKGSAVKMGTNNMDVSQPKHELALTDANFTAETSRGVVLVDFWAPWCGPCLMQGPILEKVAAAMAGQAKVGKCNVDEAPNSAERFGVRSIPTIVILKDGKEVERFVGVQQEARLVSTLKKHLP